ncbi:beta-hydroxyacyl-ACP dehydratase [Planctomycetales bacterium]|nr:beta-hydroxyacyl-ACP dehydratase [Planctomycetales bacterium]
MARRELIVDPLLYSIEKPIADLEEVRRCNAHRFEMEQITGILYENLNERTGVGYLDTSDQSFWVRGHMPGTPIMPGVLMCESAAQLTSFFVNKYNLMPGNLVGLAGLDEVRFRGIVSPGDQLVTQVRLLHFRRLMISAEFISLVGGNIVCEGIVKGISIPITVR